MTDNERLIKTWNRCVNSMLKILKKDASVKVKVKRLWIDTGTEHGYINIEKNGKKGSIIL